jgi:hypothetical protein
MLIINGTAELMHNSDELLKGSRHEFNMFSKETSFEQQVTHIEKYLVDRGWDNIEVANMGIIANNDDITHPVLIQAYDKAINEGFAVTINNQPLL